MWRSLSSTAIGAFVCLGSACLGAGLAQVSVSFTEWTVPTKGSHPHDPLAAADGTIWYTGQMASTLGRLNPRTGVLSRSIGRKLQIPARTVSSPTRTATSGSPANFAGYIGKLDPKTGAITEYRLPVEARDPHTPVFDQAGTLWFTVQGAT